MIAKSDQKTVINRDHFQMTFYGISLVEENENVYSGIRITFWIPWKTTLLKFW